MQDLLLGGGLSEKIEGLRDDLEEELEEMVSLTGDKLSVLNESFNPTWASSYEFGDCPKSSNLWYHKLGISTKAPSAQTTKPTLGLWCFCNQGHNITREFLQSPSPYGKRLHMVPRCNPLEDFVIGSFAEYSRILSTSWVHTVTYCLADHTSQATFSIIFSSIISLFKFMNKNPKY